jgi:phage tail-like protein
VAEYAVSAGETKTGQRVDPFATFKFHVEIGDIKEAAFSECSGLEISTEVFEYQEGGLNEFAHKLPGRTKHSNVTLKRGFAVSNELYKWYQEMEQNLLTGRPITRKQVSITLYSTADHKLVTSWTLNDAFPVKWVGPTFKAGEAAVAIETLELAHHGIMGTGEGGGVGQVGF